MLYQRVYCCYSALEEITLFNDVHPELYEIIFNHSEVIIDLSDETLEEKINNDPALKTLFKKQGKLFNLPDFFGDFEGQNFEIMPCDMFIVEKPEEDCRHYHSSKGICVIPASELKYIKNFSAGVTERTWNQGDEWKTRLPNQTEACGWCAVFKSIPKLPIPPYNSLIIHDFYLFKGNEQQIVENIQSLISGLIPENLEIPFEILLTFADRKTNLAGNLEFDISKDKINSILNKILDWANHEKGWSINIGAVTMNVNTSHDVFHNRYIIYNHGISKSGFGFLEFQNARATRTNSVDVFWSFNSAGLPHQADMPIKRIVSFKNELKKLIAENERRNAPDTHFLIKHYKNRLLN